MSLDLGRFSMLFLSLLLLLSITESGGGAGGIPSAFGQNTFSGNITTSDIIGLADNIVERVQEEVDNDVNLPIFSDDEENSGINDSIGDSSNGNDNNSNRADSIISSLPSPLITNTSTPPSVRINEIELNPTGEDDEGEEWIELYNPTDADINLSNYEISTSSGAVTIKLQPDAIVGAGEAYVIELEEDEDYLSNIVESLILTTTDTTTTEGDDDDDNNSIVVDRTPSLVDMSNDERTWQRLPDGNNEWRFVEETEGDLNSPDSHVNNNNSSSSSSRIVSQIYDTIEHYYSESDTQCIGYAGCIEGITTRIVDGDTLYVTANNTNSNTIYKVDLALIEAPSSMEEEERIDSTALARELCLGSSTLIDQDDKLLTTKSLVDSSSVIAVVYCSSTNLNKELLDLGYVELDMQQCATSEFANESWAKEHGC